MLLLNNNNLPPNDSLRKATQSSSQFVADVVREELHPGPERYHHKTVFIRLVHPKLKILTNST